MSRFSSPLPFTPLADFRSLRVLTLCGVDLQPGDIIPTSVRDECGERRLRALYEQRRIEPVPAVSPPVPSKTTPIAPVQGMPPADDGFASSGEPSVGAAVAAAAPAPDESDDDQPADGAFAVQKAGMGGWIVVNAEGVQVGNSHRLKKDAVAAAAALAG